MNRKRGVFRVYKCPSCQNLGFASVESEQDGARCSLCDELIPHTKSTIYAVTRDEAKEYVRELAANSASNISRNRSTRRIGLKKRVLGIVESLYEVNRQHPVPMGRFYQECADADIDLERAKRFLHQLEEEGLIVRNGSNLEIPRSEL